MTPIREESPPAKRLLLSLTASNAPDATAHLALGSALPKTRNTLPCSYFWRSSICDGDWTNNAADPPFTMSVTPDVRADWERKFRMMREGGDEVPVVMDHEEGYSPATLGYVLDMRQNGPWLEELHQYLGDGARDTALRNKLSVGVDPNYTDSRRRFHGSTIVHSATTSRPVCPGQGEARLVASAASRENVQVIHMSQSIAPTREDTAAVAGAPSNTTAAVNDRSNSMKSLPCSDETMAALHDHVPGLKDAPEEEKLSRVAQHLHTMKSRNMMMSQAARADSGADEATLGTLTEEQIHEKAVAARAEWKAAHAELPTVKQNLSAAQTKASDAVLRLSQAGPQVPALDPRIMSSTGEAMEAHRLAAVDAGSVDQATADKLDGLFRKDGKLGVQAMSQVGEDRTFGVEFWKALRGNKPRLMGTQTGNQNMSQANGNGHDDAQAKVRERMVHVANGENV